MESESDAAVVLDVLRGSVEGDDLRPRAVPAIVPAAAGLQEGLHVLLRHTRNHTRSDNSSLLPLGVSREIYPVSVLDVDSGSQYLSIPK